MLASLGHWATRWLGRVAAVAGGLILVLAAFIVFAVPGLLRSHAAHAVADATGRTLAIGRLAINPLTWSVEFHDVSLSEPYRNEIFAFFRSGRVAVSPASLWHGAPIISQMRLESPYVNLIRTGPGAYNCSDLSKYLTPIPPLSLHDLWVTGGRIDFADQHPVRNERHRIEDAELAIPFLTTVPALMTEDGSFRFSALIDAAPLSIAGQVRGLPEALDATAQINLTHLSLPAYLAYFPAGSPVLLQSAIADVQGTVSFRGHTDEGPWVGWDGSVTLTDIKATDQHGLSQLGAGALEFRSRVTLHS